MDVLKGLMGVGLILSLAVASTSCIAKANTLIGYVDSVAEVVNHVPDCDDQVVQPDCDLPPFRFTEYKEDRTIIHLGYKGSAHHRAHLRESAQQPPCDVSTRLELAIARYHMLKTRNDKIRDIRKRFPGIDGVLYVDHRGITSFRPVLVRASPFGGSACGSMDACTAATDDMCEDAGHSSVQEPTVAITVHEDGDQTCSGECEGGCNDNGCPTAMIECTSNTIIDDPDPVEQVCDEIWLDCDDPFTHINER